MVYLDILRFALAALLSMIFRPQRLQGRAWRSELLCRILRNLTDESLNHHPKWIRERQLAVSRTGAAQKQVEFETLEVAGVTSHWCRPKSIDKPQRILVYFHGGGYVFGSFACAREFVTHLALATDSWVLTPDYRLAPGHPFPAANDDCLAVAKQVVQQFAQTPVFLTGDSAGGALALHSALSLAEQAGEGDVQPAGLVLISPWVHPTNRGDSKKYNFHNDLYSPQFMQHNLELYSPRQQQHPFIDSTQRDISALPPTLLQAASGELMRSQVEDFIERAGRCGVDIESEIFEGQFHVFQTFVPVAPGSEDALEKIAAFTSKLS